LEALHDDDNTMKCDAIRAMGMLKNPKFAANLLAQITTCGSWIRTTLYTALGDIGDRQAVKTLLTQLEAAYESYELEALAIALGKLKDPRAVRSLFPLLYHQLPTIRAAAAHALQEITGQDFGEDILRWRAWRKAEEAKHPNTVPETPYFPPDLPDRTG